MARSSEILSKEAAVQLGYSPDKRKRRRQHRLNARKLLREGGVFNGRSAKGSTFYSLARWHLDQARGVQ